MRKIVKNIIVTLLLVFSFWSVDAWFKDELKDLFKKSDHIPYCNDLDWDDCWLNEWISQIRDIEDIENDRSASEYIQDVVQYLLSFLFLVAILIIIYAWFTILVAAWDEEKVKKWKSMIIYAVIWIFIIFVAWPLSDFIFSVLWLRSLD